MLCVGCSKTPAFPPTAPGADDVTVSVGEGPASAPVARTAAPPFAVTRREAYQGQETPVQIKPGEGVEVSRVPVGTRLEVKASVAGGGTFSYLAYVRRSASSAVTLMASGSQVTWPVAGAAFEANKQDWDISKAVVAIKDTITVGLGIETPAGQPTPEGSVDFRIRTYGSQPDYAVAVEPGYFSDLAEVRVNSKGTWAMFATSGGTSRKIKTGNGNLTFAWGSRPLPDGAYSLSLKDAAGLEVANATAAIDMVPPSLSDFQISIPTGQAIEYSATIRELETRVEPDSIDLSVNGEIIEGGSDTFDPTTGKYKKILDIRDAPRYAVPSEQSGNNISVVASDLAGNLGRVKVNLDADLASSHPKLALKTPYDAGGFGVASIVDRRIAADTQRDYEGVYFPLMGDIFSLSIPRLPSSGPAIAVLYRSTVITGSVVPVAILLMLPSSDGGRMEADWDFASFDDALVGSGDYWAAILDTGLLRLSPHVPTIVKVNSDVVYNWYEGNVEKHVHVCWGRGTHNWDAIFPGFPTPKPANAVQIATSLYLGQLLPLIRSIAQKDDGLLDPRGSRDRGACVEYRRLTPPSQTTAAIIVRSFRQIDPSQRFVSEMFGDSWVNRSPGSLGAPCVGGGPSD